MNTLQKQTINDLGVYDPSISNNSGDDSNEIASCTTLEDGTLQNNKGEESNDDTEQPIAHREEKTVKRLRWVVVLVLLGAMVGVAIAVYYYTRRSEVTKFEEQFQEEATKVLESLGSYVDQTLGTIDSFTVGIVSYAKATGQTFPMVTVPDFQLRVSKALQLSDVLYLGLNLLVTPEQRLDYEEYTFANHGWVNESLRIQETDPNYYGPILWSWSPWPQIHGNMDIIPYNTTRTMMPTWQIGPVVPYYSPYNWDMLGDDNPYQWSLRASLEGKTVISSAFMVPDPQDEQQVQHAEDSADWYSAFISPDENPLEPISDITYPIVNDVHSAVSSKNVTKEDVVGLVSTTWYWRDVLKDTLPSGSDGIVVVFTNPCNADFTYQIDGPSVHYLGYGDLHRSKYDSLGVSSPLHELRSAQYTGVPIDQEHCPFTINIYPSDMKEDQYLTWLPIVFTVVSVSIFLFTSLVFFYYDFSVERRQSKVMHTAVHSSAVVSSLFPSTVRDRLFEDASQDAAKKVKRKSAFLNTHMEDQSIRSLELNKATSGPPIADLFPETTVFFGDLAGFTAWSSVRQPSEVFHLLETLYGAMDKHAKRRNIFKVETIGDCYLGVAGLPVPKKNHAVAMARFARDCMEEISVLTRELELTLGPGTAALNLRVGIHSGPTTAGVLRGEKGRFQLFGDTVNTASRMESTGTPGKIQVSAKTAELLRSAGKGSWLRERQDKVIAKGKGELTTYWCEPKFVASTIMTGTEASTSAGEDLLISNSAHSALAQQLKNERLIDYNVTTLQGLLKMVIAHRVARGGPSNKIVKRSKPSTGYRPPRQDIAEVIQLPGFNEKATASSMLNSDIDLDPNVQQQLKALVMEISSLYQLNHFHNFEHASHVAMSAKKLISRISNPQVKADGKKQDRKSLMQDLHSRTYGITSDPLTSFAIIFACLVHDLDHPGVSNAVLVKEKSHMATTYNNESVAEQNSTEMAWEMLWKPEYNDLRAAIFTSEAEMKHFHQLLINVVLATDIFDRELKTQREERWNRAFAQQAPSLPSSSHHDNGSSEIRATIVIEYVIQAADVSHCMQHWTVYQKWNKLLFKECYKAFQDNRSNDPSEGWYKGELWFFDNYIIPLADKLKDCGVFGVSSDEYLAYATDNRKEWATKGCDIVKAWVEEMEIGDLDWSDEGENDGTALDVAKMEESARSYLSC